MKILLIHVKFVAVPHKRTEMNARNVANGFMISVHVIVKVIGLKISFVPFAWSRML